MANPMLTLDKIEKAIDLKIEIATKDLPLWDLQSKMNELDQLMEEIRLEYIEAVSQLLKKDELIDL